MNKVTKQNEKCMYAARINVNTATNELMDSYINYVFGASIPDTIKKDLSDLNINIPLTKVLFLFAVFCERTAVLSIESINYYNFVMDNLMVNNTIRLPSIYKDDTIKCKYYLHYNSKRNIYKISCGLLGENLPPIVHGRFCIDPSTFIIDDENNKNVADHINVKCSIIMTMIDLAMVNIAFPNQINNDIITFNSPNTSESQKSSLNEFCKDEEYKPLKYLPMLWNKGISIEFYGNWLLAVTCSVCGDDLIIRSIDDFFNKHFGELDGDYSLKEFIDELKDSSVAFMGDEYILYQLDDIDLKNIGDIISHINGLGACIDACTVKNKNDDDYHIVYYISNNEGNIYETIKYISTEYGFNEDDVRPEYIAAMYVIFYYIGFGEFLTKISYKPKAK